MNKKRTVVLFGAGASIKWGGPTTSSLTELILRTGFITKSGNYITKFIFDQLKSSGFPEDLINFETIINIIEELSFYYSRFEKYNLNSSLLKVFFNPNFEDEILNFQSIGSIESSDFKIIIPGFEDVFDSQKPKFRQTKEQFYFNLLLNVLNSQILVKISKYSKFSPAYSNVDFSSTDTENFIKWLSKKHQSSILRLYTLNYESIFQYFLESSGITLFDGFGSSIGNFAEPDIKSIYNDTQSNIFFNLHGSAYWYVYDRHIVKANFQHLPANDPPVIIEIDKGKDIMLTNIITGYQKSLRGLLSPFRQMQSAFDQDCIFADEIIIIGYSLGDEHINQSIKNALHHNKNLKLVIVDEKANKADFQNKILKHLLSIISPSFLNYNFLTRGPYIDIYNKQIITHSIKFSDFLKDEGLHDFGLY